MRLILKSHKPLHLGARVEIDGVQLRVTEFVSQGFYDGPYWTYFVSIVKET